MTKLIVFLLLVFLLSVLPLDGQESPEIVAKWHRFVESLSPQLRKAFDSLHADAAQLDAGELARRVNEFTSQLSPSQRKAYAEIQQRGGRGRPSADDDGDAGRARQSQVGGEESEPPPKGREGGGGSAFEKWADSPEVSPQTRSALRRIKSLFGDTQMDPVEKCEQIQHLLKTMPTEDKAKMKVPTRLLSMDCEKEGQRGAENLVKGIGTGRMKGRK